MEKVYIVWSHYHENNNDDYNIRSVYDSKEKALRHIDESYRNDRKDFSDEWESDDYEKKFEEGYFMIMNIETSELYEMGIKEKFLL